MRLRALFGWGIVVYAVATLASTGMELYGFSAGILPHIVELIVLFVTCVSAGSSLKFHRTSDILPYSIGWAIVFLALSGIFFVPLIGWHLYDSWMLWLDAALIAIFPLTVSVFTKPRVQRRRTWES